MGNQWVLWIGFNLFVFLMLALDLGVFHRKAHEIKLKEAMIWSGVWITLALLFNLGIYLWYGEQPGLEFLTGYLIEKSLSIDNIFLFLTIFSFFSIPRKYQHKILFWGVLGALVMRGIFIFVGVQLIEHFHWVMYVFGAFLIFSGIKMFFRKNEVPNLEKNPAVQMVRKILPITHKQEDGKFFIVENGKRYATPLFLVLVLIEATDFVFAVDSIPAILAISSNPFIVYTSNIFAILGLRSLYFALAGVVKYFCHLHYGLASILMFVGTKMLIADFYKFPIGYALGVIFILLLISILASIIWPTEKPKTYGSKVCTPAKL